MIIADDCSTDDSPEIVRSFANADSRIKLIRLEKNSGPAVCRNVCIQRAEGRYIAFLDSDDLWLPDKLEMQVGFMQELGCVLSYSAYRKIDEDGNIISATIEVPDRADYHSLLLTNVIANLTSMYDAKALGKIYLPFVGHEDYALWLKILKAGHEARGIKKCLALYRLRKGSVSDHKLRAARYQWAVYRKIEKLPLPPDAQDSSAICASLAP